MTYQTGIIFSLVHVCVSESASVCLCEREGVCVWSELQDWTQIIPFTMYFRDNLAP